jgi:pyruvate dehydrogenase E1 component alpha subunit
MFAELLGKEAGYCKGKGGSMHIADPDTGNLGANAIVGGSAGIATGAAYAAKYLKTGQVAVCFFGEGALGQGLLYEEMNLAQLWKLPVIFCCENNGYNEYTHFSESTAGDVAKRPEAFGILTKTIDGQNVREVFLTASELVDRARKGDGPAFLQCITYRYHGHHVGDIARSYYRPKAEEQEWVTERDPITLHGEWLMRSKVATREQLDKVQAELIAQMDTAMEWAIAASYPDKSKVTEDIYA